MRRSLQSAESGSAERKPRGSSSIAAWSTCQISPCSALPCRTPRSQLLRVWLGQLLGFFLRQCNPTFSLVVPDLIHGILLTAGRRLHSMCTRAMLSFCNIHHIHTHAIYPSSHKCDQQAIKQSLAPISEYVILTLHWVAVKEIRLSYHNSQTMLLTIYPYSGNLN